MKKVLYSSTFQACANPRYILKGRVANGSDKLAHPKSCQSLRGLHTHTMDVGEE